MIKQHENDVDENANANENEIWNEIEKSKLHVNLEAMIDKHTHKVD